MVFAMAAASALLAASPERRAEPRMVDADGAIHVPAFTLPDSSLLDAQTRARLKAARDQNKTETGTANRCPGMQDADRHQMPAIRRCQAEAFYRSSAYKRVRELYRVAVTPQEIAGVDAEIFMPAEGIAWKNRRRVLINVHGGGFIGGAHISSHLESIPIASLGKIKVISIDYRLAPEHVFPAATEDIVAVYNELLKRYKPKNIGLYGCSAGGLLTAEAVAGFQTKALPLPGAVGMFCSGADGWWSGDTGYLGSALLGWSLPGPQRDNAEQALDDSYFKGVRRNDPLAFPLRSPETMARFPPSLLISATRDPALSSVVHTHAQLIKLGVEADLHVWEGLGHGFFADPDIPQSREVYDVVVRFFDRHLGR